MLYNYYIPTNSNYQVRQRRIPNNRIGFGGFALPFALGFLTGPLVARPNYYYPYYPYNYNTNYNYYPTF